MNSTHCNYDESKLVLLSSSVAFLSMTMVFIVQLLLFKPYSITTDNE